MSPVSVKIALDEIKTVKEGFIQGYYNRGEKPEFSQNSTLLKQRVVDFQEMG